MKNFDEERRVWNPEERTFVLRGETFVAREHVRPETLAAYSSRLSGEKTLDILIETTDQTILEMLEGGDDETEGSAKRRYLAVRARKDDPVTLEELHRVAEWLFTEHAIRPTRPSSASLPQPEDGGTSSTVISSPAVSQEAPTD